MARQFVPGYQLRAGWGIEHALLSKFMQETYEELFPGRNFSHVPKAVEQFLSSQTPLWWVEVEEQTSGSDYLTPLPPPVGCLWMGNAIDQIGGDRNSHIFLVYVKPEHRRKGIGSALMRHAENWARQRGDRQISLQVFHNNDIALNLYQSLGYSSLSLWMVKPLNPKAE
ncbi:GNAT family N-acetyltransferase [Desertifilum tharense]|uniref:GNAT family N-acetyltransferase n=1 Tax=Desertifilum tharense IPPAS B-1220 TaxID=1781255 RepID=A0A1E5QF58_9CYAN|nr:GNAT family N-acetyltransferase [Desertifilum tharense]OEJ73289.1 GNAT family N-acetyltransferase [Desertifilum tharense IPPAS B-1220]